MKTNLFLFCTILFTLCGCETENFPDHENNATEINAKNIVGNFELIKEFPNYYQKIDSSSCQRILIKPNKDYNLDDFEVFIYTAKDNDRIVGYFIDSDLFAVYAEIISETRFNITDLRNDNYVEFKNERRGKDFALYDITNDILISQKYMDNPDHQRGSSCQGSLNLCTAGCALSTIAIGLSDGPLPIADIVAASWFITCNLGCANTYNDCMAANPSTGVE